MEDYVKTVWNIPFLDIPITNVVVGSWVIMAIIIIWAYVSTKKLKQVPTGLQNVAEIVVETINNFATNMIGKEGREYAPYLGTIGLFLGISNMIGALFATELTHGLICPPTRIIAVPIALAAMTIVVTIIAGIRKRGIVGYLKSLFKPVPIMFPFNILEFVIKPLSLSMRLFGNIFGAFIAMDMLYVAIPWGLPALASLYFDIFDGGLQTYVFVLLTSLYIAEVVEDEEEEDVEQKPIYGMEVKV